MHAWQLWMAAASLAALPAQAGLTARGLSCEHLAQPMGVETVAPRLSWKLEADGIGQEQTAYRVLAADGPHTLAADDGNLWDTGWVVGSGSRLIPYSGRPLASLQTVWWKVRVKDRDGRESPWSTPARFATGLLPGDNPCGQWIFNPKANWRTDTSWFRKTCRLDKIPTKALVLLASRGYHEFHVNGKKVDDRALAPNASIMEKRTLYVVYDIAPLLAKGDNTFAVWISPGRVAAARVDPAFLFEARLDGALVASDSSWKTRASNLMRYYPEIPRPFFGGERWDEAGWMPGWKEPDFDDSGWISAAVRNESTELSADLMPPTRRVDSFEAQQVERLPDGKVRVDFGRYFTGQMEARIKGTPGQPIRFVALGDLEKPNDMGQHSVAIPEPDGTARFEHRFHWMCGRWVEIEGLSGTPEPSDFKAHPITADFERIGFFDSSDELINRLYETDLNTYRNLTLDGYNHDCTHRERRGYGEHAFGTSRAMATQYDLAAFVRKWLRDWRDSQLPDGYMPHTAPEGRGGGGTLWSSFTVLGSWDAYVQTGDRRFLEENESSALRWMEYLHNAVTNGILARYEAKNKYYFLGDWARPVPPEKRGQEAHVANFGDDPMALAFNNGIYALNLKTMERYSDALGRADDVRRWRRRHEAFAPAAHARFFNPQTDDYIEKNQVFSMLMPLSGITPEEDLRQVDSALKAALKAKPYIDAGSSGLTVFMEFIMRHPEYHQWFFDVLHRRDYPSYAYFLDQGYDTWPELWDPTCFSKVHSCYIGLSLFFTRVLAGVEPLADAPGYERFLVKPSFVKGLDRISYEFDSPRGWIKVKWERKGGVIELTVTVPPGTTADVYLPSGIRQAESGTHQYAFATK